MGPGQPGMMDSARMPGMGPGRRGQGPEIAKLERQSHKLAQQYRRAEGEKKDQLAEKLRDTLARTFELKARVHEEEIERLERQLGRLRDRLERRRHNSEAIIQKRFSQNAAGGWWSL